jgi:transcription elongation GreA/GreB family factor
MNKTIKKLLYRHCESSLKCRLIKYKKRSDELYESLTSETQSSAGDKHETGRAMIQLDREKIGQQVKEIEKEFELFSKINSNVVLNSIGLGSLVITQENQYYIVISAEVFEYNYKTYYCISRKSPIGSALFEKKVRDVVTFNNKEIKIIEIL